MKKNIAKLLLIVTLCIAIFQVLPVSSAPKINEEITLLCSDIDRAPMNI